MVVRLPSERVPVGDIEVERVAAWAIYRAAIVRMSAWLEAKTPAAEMAALLSVIELFVAEAQPTWALADHRGPIPPTADGCLRLPLPILAGYVDGWISTHIPTPTAVDEIIPPGPLRDALNDGLKAKRRKD